MNARRITHPAGLRRYQLRLLAVTLLALLATGLGCAGQPDFAAAQSTGAAMTATPTPEPAPATKSARPAAKPDPCSGMQILLPHCTVLEIGNRAANVASNALNKGLLTPLTALIMAATETMLAIFLQMWLTLTSFDLDQQGAMSLYGMTMSIGLMIAVLLLIWQAIRTMIQGKGLPLLEAFQGLVITALVSLCGIAVTGGVMRVSDLLSMWILGDLARNGLLNKQITAMTTQTGLPAWLTIQLATLLILVLIVQIIVLWLRNATIPILALMLPIAAAGSIGTNATRSWLPKTITAILTVAAYKPIVSLIIVSAVAQFRDSTEVAGLLYALIMFVAAVIAMPALVKIFAPLGAAAGGGGSWLAQAGWMLASRLGSRGGGGDGGGAADGGAASTSAIEQEQRMKHSSQTHQQSTGQHSAGQHHPGAAPGIPQAGSTGSPSAAPATGVPATGTARAGEAGTTAAGQAGAATGTAGTVGTAGASGAAGASSAAAGAAGPVGVAAGVALEGAERLGRAAAGHVAAPGHAADQAADQAAAAGASSHPLERAASDSASGAGPIVDRNYG